LISDPAIRAELRSFVRSNKWAMDPKKLAKFSQQKMVPDVAKKYLEKIVADEMPRGLKRYMEVELFPQIHLKVGKGVSLQTARKFLHQEGFQYTEHKKSLYYNGHKWPDVVEYHQNIFLPTMEKYQEQLVEYDVKDVECKITKFNLVERWLVLCAHDEMTVQAHDGRKKSWVMDNEHALKKKGIGRGMHHLEVICSTVGWLKEAGQDLEYGKNYDGYWTGELFVKQVSSYNSS
jgi:transposase